MTAHKPVKPISEVVKNAKTMKVSSLNRAVFLSKLDDDSYFVYMRSVYSGPSIVRTKRRVSEASMVGLVEMYMELNGIDKIKIEDGQLMYTKKQKSTP